MTGYCQRPERSEISAIFERKKAEGDDDEKDGFLVDVPAKQEGGVPAEGKGGNESVPGW